MVHDEIKAAARRRMAQTGEPYCLARCKAIRVGPPGPQPGASAAGSAARCAADLMTTWWRRS